MLLITWSAEPVFASAGSVDGQGAYIYQEQIQLPPGVPTVQPSLGFSYNSGRNSNGLLGVGWQLEGLSAIRRSRVGGLAYDSTDNFEIDGELLAATTSGGNSYVRRRPTSQTIEYDTANDYWVITERSGVKFYYGHITNTALIPTGRSAGKVSENSVTVAWHLSQIEDPRGNQVLYLYDSTSGDSDVLRLAEIRYAYDSSQYFAKVELAYETRSDEPYQTVPYQATLNRRLASVTSYVVSWAQGSADETEYAEYLLTYESSNISARSRITSIQRSGVDNPSSFSWTDEGVSGTSRIDWSTTTSSPFVGVTSLDYLVNVDYWDEYEQEWNDDADHLSDSWSNIGSWGDFWGAMGQFVSFAGKAIWAGFTWDWAVAAIIGNNVEDTVEITTAAMAGSTLAADFNGDGLIDYAGPTFPIAGTFYIYIANGDGTFTLSSANAITTNDTNTNTYSSTSDYENNAKSSLELLTDLRYSTHHVADFDGDGKSEYIVHNDADEHIDGVEITIYEYNNSSRRFVTLARYQEGDLISDSLENFLFHFVDLDGDGRTDLVAQPRWDVGATSLFVAPGTANGLTGFTQVLAASASVSLSIEDCTLTFGDFDGDGRKDFIRQPNEASQGEGTYIFYLEDYEFETSGGTYWASMAEVSLSFSNFSDDSAEAYRFSVGDFNGDGADDIMRHALWTSQHHCVNHDQQIEYVVFTGDDNDGATDKVGIHFSTGRGFTTVIPTGTTHQWDLALAGIDYEVDWDEIEYQSDSNNTPYIQRYAYASSWGNPIQDEDGYYECPTLLINANSEDNLYSEMNSQGYIDDIPTASVTVGDYNGDGMDDILVSADSSFPGAESGIYGGQGSLGKLYLSQGNGYFDIEDISTQLGLSSVLQSGYRLTSDMTGDGRPDIAVLPEYNSGSDIMTIYGTDDGFVDRINAITLPSGTVETVSYQSIYDYASTIDYGYIDDSQTDWNGRAVAATYPRPLVDSITSTLDTTNLQWSDPGLLAQETTTFDYENSLLLVGNRPHDTLSLGFSAITRTNFDGSQHIQNFNQDPRYPGALTSSEDKGPDGTTAVTKTLEHSHVTETGFLGDGSSVDFYVPRIALERNHNPAIGEDLIREFTHNDIGFVTEVTTYSDPDPTTTDEDSSAWTTLTEVQHDYAMDTSGNLTSHLCDEQMWGLDPDGSLVRQTRYQIRYAGYLTGACQVGNNREPRRVLKRGKRYNYNYTSHGLLRLAKTPTGIRTEIEYDDEFFFLPRTRRETGTSTNDSLSRETVTSYDELARVQQVVDVNGNSTTMTYDSLHRPLVTTYPDGSTVTRSYAFATDTTLASVTEERTIGDGTSVKSVSFFDSWGRQVQNKSGLASASSNIKTISMEYDHGLGTAWDGQSRTAVSQPVYSSSFAYQAHDMTDAVQTYGAVVSSGTGVQTEEHNIGANGDEQYTIASGLTVQQYVSSLSTTYPTVETTTNLLGQMVQMSKRDTDTGDARTWTYTRDLGTGLLRQQEDMAGNIDWLEYDALGNLVSHDSVDRGLASYSHDDDGKVLETTDANGATVQLSYDDYGRLIEESILEADGSVTPKKVYEYDEARTGYFNEGRLTATENYESGVRDQMDYDNMGRLRQVVRTVDGQSWTMAYEYDHLGRMTQQTFPDGSIVTRSFDDQGNLDGVQLADDAQDSSPDSILASASYDIYSRPTSATLGNGLVVGTTYNAVDASQGPGAMASKTIALGATSLDEYRYSHDARQHLTGVTRTQNDGASGYQWAYDYDGHGRLTSAATNDYTSAFEYDDLQNMVDMAGKGFAFDDASRPHTPTSSDGVDFTYDSRGQLTGESSAAYTGAYTWNHDGTLASVVKTYSGTSYEDDACITETSTATSLYGQVEQTRQIQNLALNGTVEQYALDWWWGDGTQAIDGVQDHGSYNHMNCPANSTDDFDGTAADDYINVASNSKANVVNGGDGSDRFVLASYNDGVEIYGNSTTTDAADTETDVVEFRRLSITRYTSFTHSGGDIVIDSGMSFHDIDYLDFGDISLASTEVQWLLDQDDDGDMSGSEILAAFATADVSDGATVDDSVTTRHALDLGAEYAVSGLTVFAESGAADLSELYVFVSDSPFDSAGSMAIYQLQVNGQEYHYNASAIAETGTDITFDELFYGRYMMIMSANDSADIDLADVDVSALGATTAMAHVTASQSSDSQTTTPADNAVWPASVFANAITGVEDEAWWQLDLGKDQVIERLDIVWILTNHDIHILITDEANGPFGDAGLAAARAQAVYEISGADYTGEDAIDIPQITGRYVRLQTASTGGRVALYDVSVHTLPITADEVTDRPMPAMVQTDPDESYYGNEMYQGWWQIDLGATSRITEIKMFGEYHNGNPGDLKWLEVMISDEPFVDDESYYDSRLRTLSSGAHTTYYSRANLDSNGEWTWDLEDQETRGRYVRIQKVGDVGVLPAGYSTQSNYLELHEVEIYGFRYDNGGSATMSSASGGTSAELALDEDTSTSAVTEGTGEDWWQIELDDHSLIEGIDILIDESTSLSDFYVMFFTDDPGDVDVQSALSAAIDRQYVAGPIASQQVIDIPSGVAAKYVRIQRTSDEPLALAEVKIYTSALAGSEYNNLNSTPSSGNANAYMDIDLGGQSYILSIEIWDEGFELADFSLFVSQFPFTDTDLSGSESQADYVYTHEGQFFNEGPEFNGMEGRYVRLQWGSSDPVPGELYVDVFDRYFRDDGDCMSSSVATAYSMSARYDTSGLRVAREETQGGATTVTYYPFPGYQEIWSGGTADSGGALVSSKRVIAGLAEVTSSASGDELLYLHRDHLGSVAMVTDASGAVVEHKNYLPYGQGFNEADESATEYNFTGHIADGSGLIYANARYYSPRMGRFISPDTIQPGGETNRYFYANNNPIEFNDPSGHSPVAVAGVIFAVSAVIGGTGAILTWQGLESDNQAMTTAGLVMIGTGAIGMSAAGGYLLGAWGASAGTQFAVGFVLDGAMEVGMMYALDAAGHDIQSDSVQTGLMLGGLGAGLAGGSFGGGVAGTKQFSLRTRQIAGLESASGYASSAARNAQAQVLQNKLARAQEIQATKNRFIKTKQEFRAVFDRHASGATIVSFDKRISGDVFDNLSQVGHHQAIRGDVTLLSGVDVEGGADLSSIARDDLHYTEDVGRWLTKGNAQARGLNLEVVQVSSAADIRNYFNNTTLQPNRTYVANWCVSHCALQELGVVDWHYSRRWADNNEALSDRVIH